MKRASGGLALCLAVVAGCALTPPSVDGGLGGRLSVQVDAAAPEPARQLSAGFELRGDPVRGELDLTSPLGTVLAQARWQPGRAELLTPSGNQTFTDLDELSRRTFGEPLPLSALFDWLRGRPWAGAASQPLAAGTGFEQLGWQVDTGRLADGQLMARRALAPAVTLRVRLEDPR
ncbi:MAG TPA: outer membrane lipoprotein LolB [Rubrivivax sp.]